MGFVLRCWLALALLATVTTYATTFVVFKHVDLTFAQFAVLITVPMLQSVVIAWRMTRPADAIASLGWWLARQPLAQPVLVLDLLVLGAGLFFWDSRVVGLGAAVNIHGTWTLAKSAAAVVLRIVAVTQRPVRERERRVSHIGMPLALVLAANPSTSWLAAMFVQVHHVIGARAEIVQRLLFYAPAWSVLIALVLQSARRLRRHSREAAQLMQIGVAASTAEAIVLVLSNFNLPYLTQPWLGLANLFASCAASCVLLAVIALGTTEASQDEATVKPS